MTGKVPLSSKARIKKAQIAFEDFTGHDADNGFEVELPDHDTVYVLGELTGIIYRATRDGEQEEYLHKFKKRARPILCASHDGEQLYIIGGQYFVNDAGINDEG